VSAAGIEAERQLLGMVNDSGRLDLELQQARAARAGLTDADLVVARTGGAEHCVAVLAT